MAQKNCGKKIFGFSEEEIDKHCSKKHAVDPESKYHPICENEFLEPCLRGAKKILDDPKKRAFFKKIYRR